MSVVNINNRALTLAYNFVVREVFPVFGALVSLSSSFIPTRKQFVMIYSNYD